MKTLQELTVEFIYSLGKCKRKNLTYRTYANFDNYINLIRFRKFAMFLLLALVFSVALIHFNYTTQSERTTINPEGGNKSAKSFQQTFLDFPWNTFEEAAAKNFTETLLYSQLLIDKLIYFLELEPFVPVNQQCRPPSLPLSSEINCTIYPHAFTGLKRTVPAKVATLIQFGFDVDVLEIHLNELYDVVDQFFIIESTHAHYGKLKKPLMWERVKKQERFKKFPVIHFIIDDAESLKATDKQWSMESLQERLRWQKFLQWNAVTQYFSDDDIIGKSKLIDQRFPLLSNLLLRIRGYR